jgi:glycosyltransferase involved in cell wall biosynthesis
MSWLKFEVLIVMLSYAVLVGAILIGKKRANNKSKSLYNENLANSLDEISVVIPFRNEVDNLPKLLASLKKLNAFPLEFIFVNDHSEDESTELLGEIKLPCELRLYTLELGIEGKKKALSKGIVESKGNYILSWDADIEIVPTYFEALKKYSWSDLNILPVQMHASSWIGGFFAWDYQLQTQTSFALAGIVRPVIASGANLFFDKKGFLESESTRTDTDYLSGDDQFLLSAFRKSGKNISIINDENLTALTAPPNSIPDGLIQRSRWLGKSKAVKDALANGFGFIVLLIQLMYYTFAFFQLAIGNFGATIVLILIKSELDAFICTYKYQEQFNTFQVFVYELIFPIYIFSLVFLSLFSTPNWKGRSTKKPS